VADNPELIASTFQPSVAVDMARSLLTDIDFTLIMSNHSDFICQPSTPVQPSVLNLEKLERRWSDFLEAAEFHTPHSLGYK
jgi:pentose-5-phosphate-3-epimerase